MSCLRSRRGCRDPEVVALSSSGSDFRPALSLIVRLYLNLLAPGPDLTTSVVTPGLLGAVTFPLSGSQDRGQVMTQRESKLCSRKEAKPSYSMVCTAASESW